MNSISHIKHNSLFVATGVLGFALLVLGIWYHFVPSASQPTKLPVSNALTEDPYLQSTLSVPYGFHTLRDSEAGVFFNAPSNWKVQVLPEGDGQPSLTSPDFSQSTSQMTGAYLHYTLGTIPQSGETADAYMMFLKSQEPEWHDTTLGGHPAFIYQAANGFSMILSQFGETGFVTITFSDSGHKYASVLAEFQRSFHVL